MKIPQVLLCFALCTAERKALKLHPEKYLLGINGSNQNRRNCKIL